MALRVLKGEKPEAMAIENQKDLELVINMKAAEKIGLTVPEDLQKQAAKLLK
jgi:putative ABC transport system substrate-binding protein